MQPLIKGCLAGWFLWGGMGVRKRKTAFFKKNLRISQKSLWQKRGYIYELF